MRTPFFGGFDVGRSTNLADCQLTNLYPEIVENQDGKDVGAFYSCPGLDLITTAGPGPIRGMFSASDVPNGLLVVSGNQVWIFGPAFNGGQIGTIGTNSGPVSIIKNGGQTAIFDGVNGYLASGLSIVPINMPANGPASACFQDGFGLVNEVGTNLFWQSALDDLSTWNPLTFSSADSTPDNIVALASLHREIFVLKTTSIEIWIDAGLPNFAFQRLDGASPEIGCVAAASVAKMGERLVWLSQNTQGQGIVVAASNYQPVRISNHAVEREIARYSRISSISDAIAYTYQQEGHVFYVLTFPSADATLVYDATASEQYGRPMWHRRAEFLNGHFHRHWSNCAASFAGRNIVGDYRNGNLYAFNLDTLTDNGTQRKWLRTWRAMQQPTPIPVRFPPLQIDMMTGYTPAPSSPTPQLMLRWSDDGGHNWSPERFQSAGNTGETARRVRFQRLGSTRRNSGLDRIFELSSTDAFGTALIGADLVEQE